MRLLLCVLILLPVILHAQKIVSDKRDDFNNSRSINVNDLNFGKGIKLSLGSRIVQVQNSTDTLRDTSIVAYIYFRTTRVTSLGDDSQTILKFNDGSIAELPYEGKYKIFSSSDFGAIWEDLPQDICTKIKTIGIQKIRVNTSSERIDFDVSEKDNQWISRAIDLLVQMSLK